MGRHTREHGNIGVFFRAPSRPESVVRERFAALVSAQTALGRTPELEEVVLVRSAVELAGLGGPQVDYLEPVVRPYAQALLRRDT